MGVRKTPLCIMETATGQGTPLLLDLLISTGNAAQTCRAKASSSSPLAAGGPLGISVPAHVGCTLTRPSGPQQSLEAEPEGHTAHLRGMRPARVGLTSPRTAGPSGPGLWLQPRRGTAANTQASLFLTHKPDVTARAGLPGSRKPSTRWERQVLRFSGAVSVGRFQTRSRHL